MDFPTYSYVSRRLLKTRARHAKTLIRMLANGRENRECKKSEKQVRKQYATAATEKEVIQVEDWNGSATSVSHQDSDIKGLTKPHLSPHISHLYLHYISFSSLSLFNDNARAPCKFRGQALRGSLQTRKQGACPREGCRCALCTLCPAPTFTWSLG